jgi:hypothetical protein
MRGMLLWAGVILAGLASVGCRADVGVGDAGRVRAIHAAAEVCCGAEGAALAAKCVGSTPCSACKNCSGCKHCKKDGGSCGVCKK